MDSKEIQQKIEGVARPVIESLGYRLVDCELIFEQGIRILRFYIDKQGEAVAVRDCEIVSRNLGDMLDAEDLLPNLRYNLEVSSPGLDRPLKNVEDFKKYRGEVVKIKTREPIDGRSNYKGVVESVCDDSVNLLIDGKNYKVGLNQISKARVVPKI